MSWRFLFIGLVLGIEAPNASKSFGQYAPPPGTIGPTDARGRRLLRDRAVQRVGPVAHDMVQEFGEDAAYALLTCTPAVGTKLAEYHATGDMVLIRDPRRILQLIADPRHGDDVAKWVIANGNALGDPDAFEAFVRTPLEFALNLRKIEEGAVDIRVRRWSLAGSVDWIPSYLHPANIPRDAVYAGLCFFGVFLLYLVARYQKKHGPIQLFSRR